MRINYYINYDTTIREYLGIFKLGKSNIYKIMNGNLYLNDELIKKDVNIYKGDVISINYDEEIDYIPEEGKLDIIYEDDYFLVINKQPGIIIHDNHNSLCNIVANYYKKKNINLSVKYASRLDTDTSGVIIFCKDLLTLCYMNDLVLNHNLNRYYLALCEGKFSKKEDVIELPIGSDRHNNNRYVVARNGKYAKTSYKVVKEYKDYTLVELKLTTGRTHQIRVHMSHIGHPLLGDIKYGAKSKGRVMLHSYKEEFINPYNLKLCSFSCKDSF